MFNETQRVGDIVVGFPGSIRIFKKYGIDFCCGGHKPLSEAAEGNPADISSILAELETAEKEISHEHERSWNDASDKALISHILSKHHVFMKKVLPETDMLISKVLRAHAVNHPFLFRIHKLYNMMRTDIEQHLLKEEEFLFPLIEKYEDTRDESLKSQIAKYMEETEQEHVVVGGVLKEIREITEGYMLPEDACSTFEAAYDRLVNIEDDLFRHIHLENNILFRRM